MSTWLPTFKCGSASGGCHCLACQLYGQGAWEKVWCCGMIALASFVFVSGTKVGRAHEGPVVLDHMTPSPYASLMDAHQATHAPLAPYPLCQNKPLSEQQWVLFPQLLELYCCSRWGGGPGRILRSAPAVSPDATNCRDLPWLV